MKRAWLVGGAVAVCLPMLVSLLLLLSVLWPKMDGLTQHMPAGTKATVASAIVNFNGNDKSADLRAEKLDQPAAKKAERERTAVVQFSSIGSPSISSGVNGKVIIPQDLKKHASELQEQAQALEETHDYCGAEEVYTRASGSVSSANYYWYTEGMGRNGLLCGDLGGARAGLETSLEMADRYLAQNSHDEDDVADTKADMLTAREFLIVVYDRQHEKGLATKMCKVAHPGWAGCACTLKGDTVSCTKK